MSAFVEKLLSGERGRARRAAPSRTTSPMQLMVHSVRSGVSIARAERTFQELNLTLEEASRAVGLKVRTLQRRKAEKQKLDPVESEKVLRLARVADAATETLGAQSAAAEWLRVPNAALGGETPLSLLDTDIGATAVLDVLTRLEYGVFS